MKNHDNYLMPIVILSLVLLLGGNIFWLFNKQPLSDNTEIRNATTEISVSCSETKMSNDDGTGSALYYTYSYSGNITDASVQALINTMDEISSRKRKLPSVGGVTISGGAVNMDISISYKIDNRFVNLVITNAKDIMYDMGTDGRVYTLNKGDFDKLFEIIKQYDEN